MEESVSLEGVYELNPLWKCILWGSFALGLFDMNLGSRFFPANNCESMGIVLGMVAAILFLSERVAMWRPVKTSKRPEQP